MQKIYISDDVQEKLNGSSSSPVIAWEKFSYHEREVEHFLYDEANLRQNVATKPENQKDIYVAT